MIGNAFAFVFKYTRVDKYVQAFCCHALFCDFKPRSQTGLVQHNSQFQQLLVILSDSPWRKYLRNWVVEYGIRQRRPRRPTLRPQTGMRTNRMTGTRRKCVQLFDRINVYHHRDKRIFSTGCAGNGTARSWLYGREK